MYDIQMTFLVTQERHLELPLLTAMMYRLVWGFFFVEIKKCNEEFFSDPLK